MPMSVDMEVARTLKRGDILYHNILEFGGLGEPKTPATCKVLGKVRVLDGHNPERFAIPVIRQYGDKARATITWMSRDLWRTTPERATTVRRVVRSRAVRVSADEDSDSYPTPVRRVSGVRTKR